jgi:hypothetical protein
VDARFGRAANHRLIDDQGVARLLLERLILLPAFILELGHIGFGTLTDFKRSQRTRGDLTGLLRLRGEADLSVLPENTGAVTGGDQAAAS